MINLFNVRWYISESYLEDIRYLNGKVDLKEFLSNLQPAWHIGLFNTTIFWSQLLEFNLLDIFTLKFSIFNKNVEPCFVYRDYRLAISNGYIKSNFFDKLVNPRFYIPYVPVLTISTKLKLLSQIYNDIVTLYKDSPDNYAIKDGYLVLKLQYH